MKNLSIKILLVSLLFCQSAFASLPSLFTELDQRLSNIVTANPGQITLKEMKSKSVKQNLDIDIAFENYFQAKREVNIARAAFNPLTTGHAIGLGLGMNYFWEAIVLEAVLSIPTKYYNVKNKKYVRKAEFYNYAEMIEVIKNDMAHLYYDILVHEMILKTIDIEVEMINAFYGDNDSESLFLRKRLAILNIERLDIEMLYIKELEAFRNLMAITFETDIEELAPVAESINVDQVKTIDPHSVMDTAVYSNPSYLSAANMTLAAKAGLKSVRWSVVTFSGMNFSYFKRVKVAKSTYRQAQLREQAKVRQLKVKVLGSYSNLLSAARLSSHYTNNFKTTLQMYQEIVDNNQFNLIGDEAVLGISLDLLRDFRDHALANYKAWSALDDFSKASSHKVSINDRNINVIENRDPRLSFCDQLSSKDFKVKRESDSFHNDDSNDITVKIKSEYNDLVESVTYSFDSHSLRTRKVTKGGKYGFRSHQFNIFGDIHRLDGKADIKLINGTIITKEFQLY